jgi:hypothetical protein
MRVPWEELLEKVGLEPRDPAQEEDGAEKSFQDEKISDLTVKYSPNVLGEWLPVFGEPADIIKVAKVAAEHPEILHSVREEDGKCDCPNCRARAEGAYKTPSQSGKRSSRKTEAEEDK